MKIYLAILTLVSVLLFTVAAFAADKVVVIPLGGKKCINPTENSFTNSIEMTFNLIQNGTFTMGSSVSEPGHLTNETLHQVTLTKSFYMQTTEVTNKQWNTLIIDNTGYGTVNPSRSHSSDNYPVEYVNWFEAAFFANTLSGWESRSLCYNLTGCSGSPGAGMTCTGISFNSNCKGYRLPTEAEWEYAARAGTSTAYANPYSFDDTDTETSTGFNANLSAMGWYFWNRASTGYFPADLGYEDGTKPVAQKQANLWGLYDMHGNVGEWCQDLWDLSAYSADSITDPLGDTGTLRVNRGAGYGESAEAARSAKRRGNTPDNRFQGRGFRLILP
ncbi:MAG: formylglycine-generating enzyme family protein [Desulfobulbaceae bacterium]|nr:formylglycine-generating enzyme family protein [Desulfobulbaceae bacterium]